MIRRDGYTGGDLIVALFAILLFAAVTDWKKGKIFHIQIITGIAAGILLSFAENQGFGEPQDGLVPAGAGRKVCGGDRNERAAYGISGIFWKRKSFAAGAVSVCGILSVFGDLIKQTGPHVLQAGEETGRMYAGVWFRQGKGNERPWKRWWRFMMRTRDMRNGCLIM